jgi:hypothetical protein
MSETKFAPIFRQKRVEVKEGGENSITRSFVTLYSSPSIIRTIKSRRMRWARHITRVVEKRNAYRLLVAKPEGKRLLG